MNKAITVIKGDGIGPEITAQAVRALEKIAAKFGHEFTFGYALMGGCALDEYGVPLPEETIDMCRESDAVLLGAVGGPKWDYGPGHLRPEAGLLGIRGALGLFANIRPVKLFPALKKSCPLKDAAQKIDMIIVRELTSGAYFGDRRTYTDEEGYKTAYDTMKYNDYEIRRIARVAFDLARKRGKGLISVDKANVLDSSRLWREIVKDVRAMDYLDVELSDMLVDNAAMQLIRNPAQFDVIVTENLFGDILSDEASMLTGSLGMLPSASLGSSGLGLYEPIHGSAPDIAGTDTANPTAAILSAAMMLRFSLEMEREADEIETAVTRVLNRGYRTADIICKSELSSCEVVGCEKMGRLIADEIK
ncbi:MAG: 3-isopropylmalate dehydrogenase [Oscillospiraceae bacterium]|jgi:3-isopropylmalate dehydrogenase|nr:3-isopropylmalate dehydrogenase [Oscillospiraceae bacterium]